MGAAEKAMYPHLARVRAHCAVEVTLDSCVHYLREESSNAKFANKLTTDDTGTATGNSNDSGTRKGNGNSNMLGRKDSFRTSRSYVDMNTMDKEDEEVDSITGGASGVGGDMNYDNMIHDEYCTEPVDFHLNLRASDTYLNDEDVVSGGIESGNVVHRTKSTFYETKPLSKKGSRNNSTVSLTGMDIEEEVDLQKPTSAAYRSQDRLVFLSISRVLCSNEIICIFVFLLFLLFTCILHLYLFSIVECLPFITNASQALLQVDRITLQVRFIIKYWLHV